MIIKLKVESDRDNIRDFTDMLRNDENIQVNSISDIKHNKNMISIYDVCYVELEFKKDLEHRNEDNSSWLK